MQAECLSDARQVDAQQIVTLCDELDTRMQSMQEEQRALSHLATITSSRPRQAAHYRALLDAVRTRYEQLRTLVVRYCR
jgi:hypothetical protein